MKEWANKKVKEIVREAHILIQDGWSKKGALDFLKSQTILGKKYWKQIEERT